MKHTIIFDMDGVIIRSEQLWNEYEPDYLHGILEKPIADQIIGKTRGLAESLIFKLAKELGHTGTKQAFFEGYDKLAQQIYRDAPITPGIDDLIGQLSSRGASLGLVSSSPVSWIHIVLNRLKNGPCFMFIESVNDHPELKPKPSPDGYLAAMKALGVTPQRALIIEDSQTGINAAVASGANVCGFALNVDHELPHGAQWYARTTEELRARCFSFLQGEQA